MRTPILASALAICALTSCALIGSTSAPSLGWEPLFDGNTLDGWVEAGGRYDGAARWSVEDGCITGREGPNRAGGLIYTANYYRNFVFKCDVWMSYPFDSGIFLRMVPRPGDKGAQVTLDHRPEGEIAGIYSDGWLLHNKKIQTKYKRDQWNHFEVRCRGSDMHIEVWMNGDRVTDYRLPKNSKGYAQVGRIGLQVHGARADPEGSKVQFKGLYIRELPEYDAAVFECDDNGFLSPTAAAKKAGWKPLFNGKDLSGWEPAGGQTGFAVRDGMIEVLKVGDARYLRTKEDHRDFELRLDFKIEYMANSGLFLRGDRGGGDPAYSGCEVQILDDFNWEAVAGYKLKPYQFSGGLYAAVSPGAKGLLSLGVWNTYEVLYQGSRIRVILNGQTLYDVDTFKLKLPGKNIRRFQDRVPTGFIGLQRHAGGDVQADVYARFRNIYLRPLER